MACTEVLLGLATSFFIIYLWCKRNYSYWKRHGIPQLNPTPLIGDIKPFLTMKANFGLHLSKIYNDKRFAKEAVVGIYVLNQPGLIVRDPELIKSILIKDFNKFSNRYAQADPSHDTLSANNLFFVKNPHWKEMRTKLTPVFTTGKIKQMYPLMLEISKELETHLTTYTKNSESFFVKEIKEICGLFTTDMIASIAFGVRANSLQDPNNEFRNVCRNLFSFDIKRAIDGFVAFFLPKLVTLLRTRITTKEFSTFARRTINSIMNDREMSGSKRNDLIDILVALRKSATFDKNEAELKTENNDFIVAQGSLFLIAGFETSSSTMAFALYELAKQPDIQQRLREEICNSLLNEDGMLSYETINTLEYLSMVVDETLRLYPVLPFLDRVHNADASGPFSLRPHYNYKLPDGMPVYLPAYGLQRDPQYWENPNTFDPERFSNENKRNHNPMTYLPFGSGPHNCIGMRLGLLQTKLGLVHFLKNHSISPCEKTLKEINYDVKSFVLQNSGGLYLKTTNDQMYNTLAKANSKV